VRIVTAQKKKPLKDFAGEIGFRTTPESKTPKTFRTAKPIERLYFITQK